MELFDKTFWRMTAAFLFIVVFGIGMIMTAGYFFSPAQENQANFQGHM